jgi:HlyD family secretion protein
VKALLVPALWAMVSCDGGSRLEVETHAIERGEFVNSVTVTGELAAVNSRMVTAPAISWQFGQLKITQVVEEGEQVEEGDLLVQFDPSDVQKGVVDSQAELEISEAELRKARANKKSERESMEIDLQTAGIDLEIAQINLEQADFKAAIDRQQIAFELENAEIALEKARQELEN